MKKLVLWMLVLFVAISFTAFAEEKEQKTFTHDAVGYSMQYPADWLLLDKNSISPFIERAKSGEIEGINASYFEEVFNALIDDLDAVVCVSPDYTSNFNVIYQIHDLELDQETILQSMIPSIIDELEKYFTDTTILNSGEITKIGNRDFVYLSAQYTLDGNEIYCSQFTFSYNYVLYTITFSIAIEAGYVNTDYDPMIYTIISSFMPEDIQ